MASSQNGWRANDRSVVTTRNVPGSAVRLAVRNGPPGDLLLEVASLFDRMVENIDDVADDWGYAERPIRGSSTTLSNHASGTAIDLNATRHPLGTSPSANFSDGQIRTIRAIISATGGVVRWGGDYSGRKDPMHFEILDGKTEKDCGTALSRLRTSVASTMPTSQPPVVSGVAAVLRKGSEGEAVEALQRELNEQYPAYSKLVVDGKFGDATEKVVREFQRRAGLVVDGLAGPATLGKLHL